MSEDNKIIGNDFINPKMDLIKLQIRKKLGETFNSKNVCINDFNGISWASRTFDLISEGETNEYLAEFLKDENKFKYLSIALSYIWAEYYSSVWEEDHNSDINELCEIFELEYNDEIYNEINKIKSNIYHLINDKYRTFSEILDFFYDEPKTLESLRIAEKEFEDEIDAFNSSDYEGDFTSEDEINEYYSYELSDLDDYNRYLRLSDNYSCSDWLCTNFSNDYSIYNTDI